MLYECLLVLGVLAFLFLLPHLAIGMAFNVTLPGVVLVLHLVALLGAYFLWQWHHGGQTLAMKTWKIVVRSERGGQPTGRQLALRFLWSWPSLLLFGAGVLWAFVDRDRQFLHDRLAGTRITLKT